MQITGLKAVVLLDEVSVQCMLGVEHFGRACELLAEFEKRQSRFVWAHLHGFLAHAAMVSKMLSPPRASATASARSKFLRNTLDVRDGSPILQRGARDNFEHLDERLDLWLDSDCQMLVEMVFNDREGFDFIMEPRPIERGTKFVRRALILDQMTLITQGRTGLHELPLHPLHDEMKRLFTTAEKALDRGEDGAHFVGPQSR